MKGFYSTKEIAQMYNLTETTIRSFIQRGQLKATKFNRVYMITEADLKAWEATRKPRKKRGAANE